MKNFLLSLISLLFIFNSYIFGMYGNGDDWIDFLTDANQFRARMDQLGFVLGDETIKGTFGFRTDSGNLSSILYSSSFLNNLQLDSTISAGLGYTSSIFGIGLGYNFTYINNNLQVHTPVLTINALNNNLRIAIPLQIAVSDTIVNADLFGTYTGISTSTQIRYYTGIDSINALRLYINYGRNSYENMFLAQSLGFEFRMYFLNSYINDVNINPFIKVQYNTALGSEGKPISSSHVLSSSVMDYKDLSLRYDYNMYDIEVTAVLSLAANSDIVSLYVEPSLGYKIVGTGFKTELPEYYLTWGAYTEMYITPVEDLEWYFEMDVNGNVTGKDKVANVDLIPVYFETTTGITWYLPSFSNAE
ncbi:cell surface protein [Brachyspira alvinipulli]|uniref:cell surface protein n=1 Tax=Brachyspira alvinipulli TaxID=84379 RepID=UPI00048196A3|nr:cell surface protein [Brachyspira alvinipulli]